MSDTAYAFADYTVPNPPQPVIIATGDTTATISVPTIDNTQAALDKTMTLRTAQCERRSQSRHQYCTRHDHRQR